MHNKIYNCIWYDFGEALPAAEFYMSLGIPSSHIRRVVTTPADNPSTQEGDDLLVEFELGGQIFIGLNGGPRFPQTEAVSFMIVTQDQEETDFLWRAIVSNGGEESACGWCKDRWGVNWQITPRKLLDLLADPNIERSRAAFFAMEGMTRIEIASLEDAVARLELEQNGLV